MRLPSPLLLSTTLLSLTALTAQASSNHTIPVLHRFLPHPRTSAIDPQWLQLGIIHLYPGVEGSSGLSGVFSAAVEGTLGGVEDDGRGWYQVGLALDGNESRVEHTSSVRSCHTSPKQTYRLILSLPSTSTSTSSSSSSPSGSSSDARLAPSGLHMELSDVPRDGKCPSSSGSGSGSSKVSLPRGENVEVVLKAPNVARTIDLAPPPTIDSTTGKPAEPPVEKSFLQKYWLPLLGVGFFVMSQMAPEPPKQGGAAS